MQQKEIDRLKKFADEGSAVHQQKYAKVLYWGQHIDKDVGGAKKYYELSAKQGNELAIKGLKRILEDNSIIPAS